MGNVLRVMAGEGRCKTLISRYISLIPLIGDEPCIAIQSMSGWLVKMVDHNVVIATLGPAAGTS